MNLEFEDCLKRNKIRRFPKAKAFVAKDLQSAQQDLDDAQESFDNKKYKWSTIQSYYAMFHSARALLYARGYRERSHYCLMIAIRALYVETRLLPNSLIEALAKGKRLREDADYYNRWSEEGAAVALKAAKDFVRRAHKLTKKVRKRKGQIKQPNNQIGRQIV